MPEAVITGGARTATGRLLGSLKDFTAAELGAIVIKAALERGGLTGADPEYVIMGQVLQAGAGQEPADRGVRAERLEQLDPGRAAGRGRHPQHRLPDPLLLIDLAAHHGEVEDRLVKGDLGGEIVAGDPDMVDPVQHHCPPR